MKSKEHNAWKDIVTGIIVTVIGGIILAYIIQDARFAPSSAATQSSMLTVESPYASPKIPTEVELSNTQTPIPIETPVVVPTLAQQPTASLTQGAQMQLAQTPSSDVATLNIKRPLRFPLPFSIVDGTLATPYGLYINGNLVGELTITSQLILSVKAGTVNVQVMLHFGSDEANAEAFKNGNVGKSDMLVLALKPGDVINLECGAKVMFLYLKQKP